jgi:branched-chain amino acid transport system permease protein
MSQLLQFVVTGLAAGMVYSLIALSFVVVWKSSGVANLALGQLVLLSSWFAYTMLGTAGLAWYLGIPLVIVFAIILGWVIERAVLRPLIAQPILSLITVTLGLGYFIQGLVGVIWPQSQSRFTFLFKGSPYHVGSAILLRPELWAAIIALALFGLLIIYFRYSRMGVAMRATADDQKAVQACGIPVTKIFSRSWMFTCVLAAVSGILISSIPGKVDNSLISTGLQAFSVVILGGLDSFAGAMIAGPIIGLVEIVGSGYLAPLTGWSGIREVVPFLVIIIVMFIRPYGLFGEQRIERI